MSAAFTIRHSNPAHHRVTRGPIHRPIDATLRRLAFIVPTLAAASAFAQFSIPPSSVDALDVARGATITAFTPGIQPGPEAAFGANLGGAEPGVAFAPSGDAGDTTFIDLRTPNPVTLGGVRIYAKNDGSNVGFRRSMRAFRLFADTDGDGVFETIVTDAAIKKNYNDQAGNAATQVNALELEITFPAVTAQDWRFEFEQGVSFGEFDGVRIIEVDGLTAFRVTNLLDGPVSANGDLPGSLRQAIRDAHSTSAPAVIDFDPSLAGGVITLTAGEISISRNLTVAGPGADQLTISARAASRHFRIINGNSTIHFKDVTLADGNGTGPSGRHGGAIRSIGGSIRLNLSRCVFRDNTAPAADFGSAIAVIGGPLNIDACAFVDNLGGQAAVYIEDSRATIRNTTMTGGDSPRGALWVRDDADATISHSTIADNRIGLFYEVGAGDDTNVTYDHTIFANDDNFFDNGGNGVINLVSGGFNLLDDADPEASPNPADSDLLETNPLLGALTAEAGTLIFPLLTGSPAIDAGDPTAVAGVGVIPDFDQRGSRSSRVTDGRIEIGAFEFGSFDRDRDGVPNEEDICPTDPLKIVDAGICGCDQVDRDDDGDNVCDDFDVCVGDDAAGDTDGDGICDDLDLCAGDDASGDRDVDGVCDDLDVCAGDDATGDTDGDGVCDDTDACEGNDGRGDSDGDGVCDDLDVCAGDNSVGDSDGDGVCDDRDICSGNDNAGDTDGDGVCDDIDLCDGDDALGDIDGDGVCDAPPPAANVLCGLGAGPGFLVPLLLASRRRLRFRCRQRRRAGSI